MSQVVTRRLLLVKVTEIVEVTETITILIENESLKVDQSAEYVSKINDDRVADAPPELNELLLNVSAADSLKQLLDVLKNINK